MGVDGRLEYLRQRTLQIIEETRVAGQNTRHNRSANLAAIQSLVDGDLHYTWNVRGAEKFNFEDTLKAISSITRCSSDPNVTSGGGYISPESTLKGIEEAADRIYRTARRRGTFFIATGHPGSMTVFYSGLGRIIRRWGGTVLQVEESATIPPNLNLDYVHGVAVTTDRASMLHSHDFRPMEIMLEASGGVDMVIADHGFAAAAINAGIPVVAVMDTNDPALAVARELGANLTIIPMDDNRPLNCYVPLLPVFRRFGEYLNGVDRAGGDGARGGGEASETSVTDETAWFLTSGDLQEAETLIDSRMGSPAALDESVTSWMVSFLDQFMHTTLRPEEQDQVYNNPYLELVILKQLHDAMERSIIRRIQSTDDSMSHEDIIAYLDYEASDEDH